MLKLIFPINPIPAPRARTVRTKSGQSLTYKEDFYAEWQEEIQYLCREMLFPEELPIFEKGIKLKADILFKFYLEGHKGEGDWDNYLKSFCDSMNNILWYDDKDIRESSYLRKEQVEKEEDSCIILTVQEVPWLLSKWESFKQFPSTMQAEN